MESVLHYTIYHTFEIYLQPNQRSFFFYFFFIFLFYYFTVVMCCVLFHSKQKEPTNECDQMNRRKKKRQNQKHHQNSFSEFFTHMNIKSYRLYHKIVTYLFLIFSFHRIFERKRNYFIWNLEYFVFDSFNVNQTNLSIFCCMKMRALQCMLYYTNILLDIIEEVNLFTTKPLISPFLM